jgi:hypothetical protein
MRKNPDQDSEKEQEGEDTERKDGLDCSDKRAGAGGVLNCAVSAYRTVNRMLFFHGFLPKYKNPAQRAVSMREYLRLCGLLCSSAVNRYGR